MHQKIIERVIIQKELGLLAGVIEFLHNAPDVLVREELFQRGFGTEKSVDILRCQMTNQPAFILLAPLQEVPVLLGFNLQIIIPDHLFDLRQNGVDDGAGADIQFFPHLIDIHPLFAGQQTGEDLPHPVVILRSSFRRGQGAALLQPIAVSGGEDLCAAPGIDFMDIIADRPLAYPQNAGQRCRRHTPV